MPRGRPAQAPTRSLNIRVDVEDLDMLSIIQTVTKVPTAEVVRKFLKEYIEEHKGLLQAMGAKLQTGTYWGAISREQLEMEEERNREEAEEEARLEAEEEKRNPRTSS